MRASSYGTPPSPETTRAVAMGCAVMLAGVGVAALVLATALAFTLIR